MPTLSVATFGYLSLVISVRGNRPIIQIDHLIPLYIYSQSVELLPMCARIATSYEALPMFSLPLLKTKWYQNILYEDRLDQIAKQF